MSNWKVIQGDCRDVLRSMPDASVDAVVTDPPYFRVKDDEWDNQWSCRAKFVEWLSVVADQWVRVIKPNGSLFSFASPDSCDDVAAMMRKKFHLLNRIRWVKRNGWHRKADRESLRSFLSPWEEILFAEQFASDKHAMGEAGYDEASRLLHQRVYAPIGLVIQKKREAAGLQRWQIDTACSPSKKPTGLCYRWEEGACLPRLEQFVLLCRACGDTRGDEDLRREYEDLRRPFSVAVGEVSDVWTGFETVAAYPGKHPCEKPIDMLSFMIQAVTKDGAVVLDSFAGSGTTGVACVQTGRNFIGIEIDPGYCEIARRRIADAVPLCAEVAK